MINIVKNLVSAYSSENVYKELMYDHDLCLYYSVTLWGEDGIRDLAFLIEYHKIPKTLCGIVCNTRKFTLYDTLNVESVKAALEELEKTVEI